MVDSKIVIALGAGVLGVFEAGRTARHETAATETSHRHEDERSDIAEHTCEAIFDTTLKRGIIIEPG